MSGGDNDGGLPDSVATTTAVTMVAKYGKEKIELPNLSSSMTIGAVKELLREKTGILAKRQKMIGLKAIGGSVSDETVLSDIKAKKAGETVHQFILMGTPEEHIFVDPGDKDDLPDVIDDFELDFNAGSEEVSGTIHHSHVFTVHGTNHYFTPSFIFFRYRSG